MKILFIDHVDHQKTRSADFFLSVLRRAFSVTEHYYNRYYRTRSDAPMREHDLAVIWEFPVSRRRFFFPGKRNVFVPMYDNEWASFWQWKRIAWSGMGVISFCDKVSAHARRCGVTNLLDVRYFPNPDSLPQSPGDPRRVFLWERGFVTRQMAETLFPPSAGYTCDVKGADEFLPRDEYLKRLSACGIVIAPRQKEGIGMAFLEALAMGKCVIANNDATMSEYLTNGETGILFDSRAPEPVDAASLARIRRNLPELQAACLRRWMADEQKINAFLATQRPCRPDWLTRVKLAASYPLYLIEGLFWKLRHA